MNPRHRDKRSFLTHCLLFSDKQSKIQLLSRALEVVTRWLVTSNPHHPVWKLWKERLESQAWSEMRTFILGSSVLANRHRRSSPFSVLLTEQEKSAVANMLKQYYSYASMNPDIGITPELPDAPDAALHLISPDDVIATISIVDVEGGYITAFDLFDKPDGFSRTYVMDHAGSLIEARKNLEASKNDYLYKGFRELV